MAENGKKLQITSYPRAKQEKTVKVSIPFSNVDKIKKKRAGSLKFHVGQWRKITSDPWVLQTIKGCKIEFIKEPFQKFSPRSRLSKFSAKEIELIDNEVRELIKT